MAMCSLFLFVAFAVTMTYDQSIMSRTQQINIYGTPIFAVFVLPMVSDYIQRLKQPNLSDRMVPEVPRVKLMLC